MEHNITILFYTRIYRKRNDNRVPIYLRITLNGKRIEHTTNRFVDRSKWSSRAGKMKGTNVEAKSLNNFLDALRNRVHKTEREMVQDGKEITYESFKSKWFGVAEKPRMILEIFKQHNDEVEKLAEKDYLPATLKRYKTSLRHTRNFILWKYNVSDLDVKKLNYEFISSYSFWFKSIRNCNHNTTMKYLTNFKKIVLISLKNGWIDKDPFIGFKFNKHEVDRPFLTDLEIQSIHSKKFKSRLDHVREDISL